VLVDGMADGLIDGMIDALRDGTGGAGLRAGAPAKLVVLLQVSHQLRPKVLT
jgi:hypothetical protein